MRNLPCGCLVHGDGHVYGYCAAHSKRKPHKDFAGYMSERRNKLTGDYTIILDCKLAASRGVPLVEDYKDEGGRYQILCNKHSTIVHTSIRAVAYDCMKDTTNFCDDCREIERASRGTA